MPAEWSGGTERAEATEVEAASEMIDAGIHDETRRPLERSSRWRQAADPRQTKYQAEEGKIRSQDEERNSTKIK